MLKWKLLAWILMTVLLTGNAFAKRSEFDGKVVGILDGDTVDILDSTKTVHRIRLADIDAPEKSQPYGKAAKQYLSELVFGKTVTVTIIGDGGWNRELGRVVINGVHVNQHLIESGNAWVYRKYSNDAALIQLEDKAKNNRSGLWRLPEKDQIPPWEWRHRKKNNQYENILD